jgi:PPK2 family polyphosphate:nucleotide phosphotransferase
MKGVERYRVSPGAKVDLASFDPSDTSAFAGGKKEALAELAAVNARLEVLQEMLYAQNRHRLLIVLQGMDTCGKDGVIRTVFDGVNPQGVQVTSFGVPSEEELEHDYLWRVHGKVPGKGRIMIFNRSHYEDVLVVRVNSLVPRQVWSRRYGQINAFEEMLVEEGTTILKLFLHISREEQRARLQERIDDPAKRWKFRKGDLSTRERWDDYMAAFRDMLAKTSTGTAPWYVIPSDRNWYRNHLVARLVVDTLERLDLGYPEPEEDLSGIVVK